MKSQSLFTGPIARRALIDAFIKLDPRWLLRNPVMFSVEVVTVLVTGQLIVDIARGTGDVGFEVQIAIWLWLTVLFANFAEAIAEGRGRAQAEALRATRTTTIARKLVERGRGANAGPGHPQGRPRRLRDRRRDSDRWRDHRGNRIGRRVGDDRRVGPGDPRGGRRPQLGHGWHAGALRPDRDPRDRRSRRDVPRPHDPARRGRDPSAHAERDRTVDPARRPVDRVRGGLCRAPADGALREHRRHARRPRGPVRRADPDHDRRPPVGDRHRRHEPAGAQERARHVGTCRRGGG